MELLSALYEIDCFDYNRLVKSRSQCIFNIFKYEYLKNDCFPKNDEMMTYISYNFNYAEFRVKFCENSNVEFSNKSLFKKCRKPCYEELYEIWYSNKKVNHLILEKLNPFYFVLEHNPETIFIQYLANFGGLLGL
jgi:hypothetical protein